MSSITPMPSPKPEESPSEQNPLVRTVLSAIRTLVDGLSPEERAKVLAEITEIVRPITAPRAGEILGKIIRLLPKQHSWTVDELKKQVADGGTEAEPKEVYNAVSYLAKKGHLRRVGYGRYVVGGVEIVTNDDLGGETARHEDAYRCDPGQAREDG